MDMGTRKLGFNLVDKLEIEGFSRLLSYAKTLMHVGFSHLKVCLVIINYTNYVKLF